MVTGVYFKKKKPIGAMLRVSHKSYANEVTMPPPPIWSHVIPGVTARFQLAI